MKLVQARAAALLALAGAALIAGVVWFAPPPSGEPASPSPWGRPPADADEPVDPHDPLAILVQAEPSPDGRWLVFGLDIERVAGAQSLYVVSLRSGERLYLGEGVLAPQPWDDDGRLVFVDRSTPAPLAIWFDVERFDVHRAAPIRELAGPDHRTLLGPQWAERFQTRRPEGGYIDRIAWREREATLELRTESLFDVELSPLPGVVFELRREADARALVRHDLRAPRGEVVLHRSKDLALFRVAPDGASVLTSERAEGIVSFSVRDGRGGSILAGPWSGERVTASWLARADGRYVLLARGESAELVDLERGASAPLGEHRASELDVRVLQDGRILRRTARTLHVLDAAGTSQLTIFPPE